MYSPHFFLGRPSKSHVNFAYRPIPWIIEVKGWGVTSVPSTDTVRKWRCAGWTANGWLRIWWWFRRGASAAQFRARWYHCCHFIVLSCCLSFFLVFSCFFCHSLPICLLFIVIWSFLVLFWFAGFGSAAPPKTYFLATVESGFATFRSFDVIFCCFMPLLLSGLVGFRIIGNQIKRQKSHDEWQRPNEKEMTKTWHLFDNPQCVLARCSQQIVGQPHVYKWCQHQPTVCTHAAWQNQLPEYDKKTHHETNI